MADFQFTGLTLTAEGKKFMAEMKKLAESEVHVGFQAGVKAYEDGTDLVDVAAYNEFGTSDMPARPFMKQSFERNEDKLKAACKAVNETIVGGGTAEEALKVLGTFAKGLIQEEIIEGDFAPNAPSTVKKKGSARPLIDSGLMRQSVQYVIKRG